MTGTLAAHTGAHRAAAPRPGGRRAAPPVPERHPVLAALRLGFSAGLLGLVLFVGVVAIALPGVTGGVPLTVLSASMEPELPVGTLLVVRPVEAADVRLGDVVSYQPYPMDPTLITHRVVGIDEAQDGTLTFTLRGDANDENDPPVGEHQVRAKVWYSIPLLGHVNSAVNSDHADWVIPTAAGLLFAYAGYSFIGAAVDARRRARASIAPAPPAQDDDASAPSTAIAAAADHA